MYSNSCCRCSFEAEIIKIGQSSHKMYSNNILNFQESMTILNACTKKSGILLNIPHMYRFINENGCNIILKMQEKLKYDKHLYGIYEIIDIFILISISVCTCSLPLLPGPLWPWVVVVVRVPFKG